MKIYIYVYIFRILYSYIFSQRYSYIYLLFSQIEFNVDINPRVISKYKLVRENVNGQVFPMRGWVGDIGDV